MYAVRFLAIGAQGPGIAVDLAGQPFGQQIVFAKTMPGRITSCGRALHNIFAVFDTQLADHEACILLVLCGIGQDCIATTVARVFDSQQQLLEALDLTIQDVPGYVPHIAGCRHVNGQICFDSGDVISLHYISEALQHRSSEEPSTKLWETSGDGTITLELSPYFKLR